MPLELECKLAVQSHDPVRERLRAVGAASEARVLEVNRFFDRPNASLRAAGQGLRIREQRDSGVGPGTRRGETQDSGLIAAGSPPALLTFKGPARHGSFKSREEIELSIGDADAAKNLLCALGFIETLVFEKRRERWRLGDCHVELDELPQLGYFVEVEGPSEDAIRHALQTLGLSAADVIPDTYVALVAHYCRARNLPPELRF